ncbi:hypothetical protein VTK56DRAFT_1928 [Thermocarpiscus australiensis]
MPTMTKLPSESFWPAGPSDADVHLPFSALTGDSDSSIISPLALPRGVAGYFDHLATKGSPAPRLVPAIHTGPNGPSRQKSRGTQMYSPLSPGARGPALQHPSFLSPHLLPVSRQGRYQLEQQRSSSLPPNTHRGITSPGGVENGARLRHGSAIGGLSVGGLSPVAGAPMPLASPSHPQSISGGSASASSHVQMIRRLAQQNSRIREAWEAERKYMEANRERAEEVYREERALMEEERAVWEAEKAALLQEIERLQQEVSALRKGAELAPDGTLALSTASFSSLGLRGGACGKTPESVRSSQSSQGITRSRIHSGGSAVRNKGSPPLQTGQRQANHSLLGGAGGLELSPINGPNGTRSSPPSDFLGQGTASDPDSGPVPIVDVHEIHPELEGIPLKANAIQKPTFTDTPSQNGSKNSSRSASPPSSSDQPKSRRSSKEQTLQVLAADESDRLIMHAGHTPSHSLSSLPTIASSGTATATSNGGDSTPTLPPQAAEGEEGKKPSEQPAPTATEHFPGPGCIHKGGDGGGQGDEPPPLLPLSDHDDHPEPVLPEPSEDRALKGPLMVRNVPAHDEIFFQRLSDRLEEVCKDGQAALPAVLLKTESGSELEQEPEPEPESVSEPVGADANGKPGRGLGHGHGHGNENGDENGNGNGNDKDNEESTPRSRSRSSEEEDVEVDIPLKFKRRMNFGAPFGEVR